MNENPLPLLNLCAPQRARVLLVLVVTLFLNACGSQYAYKKREYADPDDELYGRSPGCDRYAVTQEFGKDTNHLQALRTLISGSDAPIQPFA